jgi:CRP/FNR family transcriptional regulator
LLRAARRKQIDKNQVLYYQDDPVSDIMYLDSGIVKMYDIDTAGNEKILHLFKTPAFIPLASFSGDGVETRWFYAALTECQVAVIHRADYDALLAQDYEVHSYLTHWFSSEVHEILTRLNSLSKTQTRDKLYAALKYLATYHIHTARGPWSQVTFPVTHQLLADFIGVSRESVTYALRDLERDKIVKFMKIGNMQINCNKLFKV